eukprot:11799462-Karenia_brevis.AAC.1
MGSTEHVAMTPQAPTGSRVDDNDAEVDAEEDGSGNEVAKGVVPLAWRMEQMNMEERMMKNMREMMKE